MVWWKRKKPAARPPEEEPSGEGVTRRELLRGAYSSAVAAVLFGSGAAAIGCDSADPRSPTGKAGGGYADFANYGYADSLGYHDTTYADAAYDDSYDDGYDDGAVSYGDGYDDGYDDSYGDYADGGYGDGYGDSSYDNYSYDNSYYNYTDSYYNYYDNYENYARPTGPQRHRHHGSKR